MKILAVLTNPVRGSTTFKVGGEVHESLIVGIVLEAHDGRAYLRPRPDRADMTEPGVEKWPRKFAQAFRWKLC